jgi:rhodanese-related sulfurtransferase
MQIKRVSPQTLKEWMDHGEAVVIDVREPGEFAEVSIPGATLVPVGQVCGAALPDPKGKKVVVHCRSGKRSAMACDKLVGDCLHLDEIYDLDGGIMAWVAAGYPTK